jgi:hypothetical protein
MLLLLVLISAATDKSAQDIESLGQILDFFNTILLLPSNLETFLKHDIFQDYVTSINDRAESNDEFSEFDKMISNILFRMVPHFKENLPPIWNKLITITYSQPIHFYILTILTLPHWLETGKFPIQGLDYDEAFKPLTLESLKSFNLGLSQLVNPEHDKYLKYLADSLNAANSERITKLFTEILPNIQDRLRIVLGETNIQGRAEVLTEIRDQLNQVNKEIYEGTREDDFYSDINSDYSDEYSDSDEEMEYLEDSDDEGDEGDEGDWDE